MTARLEDVETELGDLTARRIESGDWPWSFFCYPEQRPRPVFPSSFFLLAPGGPEERLGLAVRCPACEQVSLNLVSHEHVDLPFHNDEAVGVVEHVFARTRCAPSRSSAPSSTRPASTPGGSCSTDRLFSGQR